MTSKDLLASAPETPAPRGLAPRVRAEWFFLFSAASAAAFALFEDRLYSRLDNPPILTAILLWLFGVALWSSLPVVRHAESLAGRLGEPYGTLLLTLTIASIGVIAISAVVRRGSPDSDARYLARSDHDHHERHGGGDAADWRRQVSAISRTPVTRQWGRMGPTRPSGSRP
jgi:hypothetical protein